MGFDTGKGVSGAASGAKAGSVFGPVGTVAGGIIGGVAGGFSGDAPLTDLEKYNNYYNQRRLQLAQQGAPDALIPQTVGMTQNRQDILGNQFAYEQSGQGQAIADTYQNYGASSLQGGYGAQNYYNNMAQGIGIPQASIDMNMVNQYSNNPHLQGQINAANQGTYDTLHEQALPGARAGAARAGQFGSSRHGAAEAIARRGAATIMANTSANMRGQAYDRGMQMAQRQSEFNTNMQADLQMNAARQQQAMAASGLGYMDRGYRFGRENLSYQQGLEQYNQNEAARQQREDYLVDKHNKYGERDWLSSIHGMGRAPETVARQGSTMRALMLPAR